MRRGQIAYAPDRFGNVRMTDSPSLTARTYFSTNPNNAYPECFDDPYETSPNDTASNDTTIELEELEALLRRYDQDVSALPDRLKRFVTNDLGHTNLTHAIYSSISTRSNELRYPNMAAIAKHNRPYAGNNYPLINNPISGGNIEIPEDPAGTCLITNGRNEGSFLRWIQLLHQEQYPLPVPALELDDIKLLFPFEFRKALRLDLNRPFGNGVDGDNDGQIDEPEELSNLNSLPNEVEAFPNVAGTTDGTYQFGYPNYPNSLTSLSPNELNRYIYPLQSRKLLCDNCIAWLN